jgi:hypothetical protein
MAAGPAVELQDGRPARSRSGLLQIAAWLPPPSGAPAVSGY